MREAEINNSMLLYVGILLFGVFISSISQVMLKKSSSKVYKNIIFEYLNPQVIGAYFLFFFSSLLSVFAYKEVPLSLGPALEATSYLYITFWGVTIFKEKLTKQKIFSLVLIILGICVYSFIK